jgi:hypothetical protein
LVGASRLGDCGVRFERVFDIMDMMPECWPAAGTVGHAVYRRSELDALCSFSHGRSVVSVQTANPKQGGDLKDAPNKFAGEFQGRATDTAAFGGGNPVGEGVKNIRDTAQQVPNFLGGGGVIRDESVSPEQAAKDNIATAKAGTGSVLESAKSALGIK